MNISSTMLTTYPYNSNIMCQEYLDLFNELNKSSVPKLEVPQDSENTPKALFKYVRI